MSKTPMPAHEVPVYRAGSYDELVALEEKLICDGRRMDIPPFLATGKSDDELRAMLVCLRRPDRAECDYADEVQVILVPPYKVATDGAPTAAPVDEGCVALETRKIQHLRTKGTP